ncbi:hypothetical protein [Nocardia sp. alder85J]|uniref:hypothetical protein n=1 Tax=Nocardia sp. alder85J TaxID=2862949 RepID=UPI001CD297EF|nr:hypothetical protein [Nocardia sp. alder85J]MCX4093883.1 hypothetical protein [Nocardia sp. alder85J]
MDPVVVEAGTTLVKLMATDAWPDAKAAVTGWWQQHHPGQAGQLGADLDLLRAEVVEAGADRPILDALTGEWQLRLRRLVATNPALLEQLRRLVTDHLTPLLRTPADTTVTQTATVTGDGNTTIQAGRDVSVSRNRSITIDTGGGDFHGTAVSGDHNRVVHAPGAVIGAIGDNNTQVNHFHRPR